MLASICSCVVGAQGHLSSGLTVTKGSTICAGRPDRALRSAATVSASPSHARFRSVAISMTLSSDRDEVRKSWMLETLSRALSSGKVTSASTTSALAPGTAVRTEITVFVCDVPVCALTPRLQAARHAINDRFISRRPKHPHQGNTDIRHQDRNHSSGSNQPPAVYVTPVNFAPHQKQFGRTFVMM